MDNGTSFASVGQGGLSGLSVWFIELGIRPERIEPGHPEKNGWHGRMHRELNPARVPEIEYHGDVIIRQVRHSGEMKGNSHQGRGIYRKL